MATLRALLWTAPLIVLATAFMGTVNLVTALWDREGTLQLKIARAWGRLLLRIAGVKVCVEGFTQVDPNTSYVVVANHVSYMDTPVILAHLPVNFRFLAKSELFKIPFIGSHLSKAGHISVPRNDPRAALKVLGSAGKMLKERGISVLVFPEGGRSADGALQPFKDGAAYMALKGGIPVLPIGLTGMHAILPMHSALVRPGKVVMCVGEPIPTEHLAQSQRAELTAQLREAVVDLRHDQPVYTA